MDLAVTDARYLVARRTGFESWDELVRSLTSKSPAPALATAPRRIPFCRIDAELGIVIDGAAADQHWDDIIGEITERRITAVLANGLNDRGLEALTRAKDVTQLTVGGAQVTDDGMRHLARMSQIEELNLGGPKCRITDRGLEALLHLRELRRFTMAWAPLISDTGIANLAAGERLEHVDLMGTILSRLTMLERLEFSEIAGISDAGLKALVPLPRLRKISVSGSPKVTRAAMAIELFAWIRFSQPVM